MVHNSTVSTAQHIPSELIQHILRFIVQPTDLLQCALTCNAWSYHALELLWYKPYFARPSTWHTFCEVLSLDSWSFPYHSFIRRINLSSLSTQVTDTQLGNLKSCERLERVTLVGCSSLTDAGLLGLLGHHAGKYLTSMDLSDISTITDRTIIQIAHTCPNLQGLNLSMCKDDSARCSGVTDTGITTLADHCRHLRRIKLNNCDTLTDASAIALARKCPRLLEIDCPVTDEALIDIFTRLRELREFRLQQYDNITDLAFTPLSGIIFKDDEPRTTVYRSLENVGYFDQLRILDLTNASYITDEAIRLIIHAAPKIRNLMLNKCKEITDEGVLSICQLGRHLHYLHLGHCDHLTDKSIIQLARTCTRIRYLDLAQCSLLTNAAVSALATLPRLKRIGLVKCFNITDDAIDSLTKQPRISSSLERVHLSYCIKLSEQSIRRLLNFCPRLNHLSLTHVPAFLRPDFQRFRRVPPKNFTLQQQNVFCVFSGKGVKDLRTYLNDISSSNYLFSNHEGSDNPNANAGRHQDFELSEQQLMYYQQQQEQQQQVRRNHLGNGGSRDGMPMMTSTTSSNTASTSLPFALASADMETAPNEAVEDDEEDIVNALYMLDDERLME